MSFDVTLFAKDTQGSLQAVRSNPDGALLSALDVSDITVDTDLDSLNGTTIATGSGVTNAGTLRVVQVVDAVNSINVMTISDQTPALNSGVANAGTLRVVQVTDVGTSTNTQGDIANAATDSGNPVKIGGVTRTTSDPTGTASGQRVDASFDKVGRMLVTPYHARGLIQTAYVSLTTGTEATLLAAGGGGVFYDLGEITFANTSTGVVNCDLREATAGGIVKSFTLPGSSTNGATFTIPIPQSTANLPWTADMDDVTNSTLNVSATFIKQS